MKQLSLISKIVLLLTFTLAFRVGAQDINLKTCSTQIGYAEVISDLQLLNYNVISEDAPEVIKLTD